jgi:purine-cytosine permease-like protein
MWSRMRVCVCVCVLAFVCVCVFAHVPAVMQKHTTIYVSMSAFIKQWCIICIAHSFVIALADPKTQS